MKRQMRICAHRGYNKIAPENTLAAFNKAIEWGVQELEFDLWPSKDGDMFVCHDPSVDRTTNGKGLITELTTKELRELDAGIRFSEDYKGEKIPMFEEVLEQFGNKAVFNIHIKSALDTYVPSEGMKARSLMLGQNYTGDKAVWPLPEGIEEVLPEIENRTVKPYDEKCFQRILDALDAFDCRKSVYITGEKDVLMTARDMAPDIPRCNLEGHMNFSIVENGIKYGCTRVQFCKGLTTQKMIDRAKAAGLICNLFWSDNADEALKYLDAGIDCLLVNNLGAME